MGVLILPALNKSLSRKILEETSCETENFDAIILKKYDAHLITSSIILLLTSISIKLGSIEDNGGFFNKVIKEIYDINEVNKRCIKTIYQQM